MNNREGIAALAAMAVALTAGCTPKSIPIPERPRHDLIVLLPDPDGGTVGRALVSNAAGTVDLAEPRASTAVALGRAPESATVMSEDEVQQVFGEVLAALPPPSQSFTLFFRFDSEELTEESRTLGRQVLQTLKERPFPEVVVRGHTDTTGTAAQNFELGLKRANTVRALLIETGVDPASIDIISHGESELLVRTADEVFEPRNRRVEITVR
jgi:outer membrane protein OmpA-like peptidoglycan-associated protein